MSTPSAEQPQQPALGADAAGVQSLPFAGDRTVQFIVRGGEFRVRRPSRADTADINARFVRKITSAAPSSAGADAHDIALTTLNNLDGRALMLEATFEVLLQPRANANLGERAPSHWLRQIKAADGETVVASVITFDSVDEAEFDDVGRWVEWAMLPADQRAGQTGPPAA